MPMSRLRKLNNVIVLPVLTNKKTT